MDEIIACEEKVQEVACMMVLKKLGKVRYTESYAEMAEMLIEPVTRMWDW